MPLLEPWPLTFNPLLINTSGLFNVPAATMTFFALTTTSLVTLSSPAASTFPDVHVPLTPTAFLSPPPSPSSHSTSSTATPSINLAPALPAFGNQCTAGPCFSPLPHPKWQDPHQCPPPPVFCGATSARHPNRLAPSSKTSPFFGCGTFSPLTTPIPSHTRSSAA